MHLLPAKGSVISFGVFELDLRSGEIRKAGVRIKLRPQAFRVLTVLAGRSGDVVSREEIQKELWSDGTFVDFEQGLNFCIRQIRSALGDDADSPRFIETIPRRGYRFLLPVTVSDPPAALSVSEAPVPACRIEVKSRRRWPWAAGAAVLLGAGSLAWFILPSDEPKLWRPTPLTSYPGVERHPAVSPDGKHVAFSWNGENQDNFDIYVKPIGSGTPRRLTTNAAEEVIPAWSPDGSTIAFLRRLSTDRNELLLMAASGGEERRLAETRGGIGRFLASLAWSPDGRWLAVSHREPEDIFDGLFLISTVSGEKRRLTSAPRGQFGDFTPAFSSDGKSIAFCRLFGYSAGEIHILSLSENLQIQGEPRRLTADGFARNPVWSADGRDIVYVTGQSVGPPQLRVIGATGSRRSRRIALLEDRIDDISLGRHQLAYSRAVSDTNIWRAEIHAAGGSTSTPERFISSTRNEGRPRYSLDGKKIAFSSDRSGSSELWIADTGGSNAVKLTSFGGPQVGMYDWSPDSRQIAFHARPEGQADLFAIPAAGGEPRRLTTHPSDDLAPVYSHDGRWIYFVGARSGRREIWKMPAGGGEAIQVTRSGGGIVAESTDGKTLYYCHELPEKGIWKIPAEGGPGEQVAGAYAPPLCGLAVTADGIYYTAAPNSHNQYAIQFVSFATGRSRPVVISDRPLGTLSIGVSPDQRYIVYGQQDQSGSDLMLIGNFSTR